MGNPTRALAASRSSTGTQPPACNVSPRASGAWRRYLARNLLMVTRLRSIAHLLAQTRAREARDAERQGNDTSRSRVVRQLNANRAISAVIFLRAGSSKSLRW